MAANYKIITTRQVLALYLAWEFGHQRAVQMLATLPKKGLIAIPDNAFCAIMGGKITSKKAAQNFISRVSIAHAHQCGRLNLPLTYGPFDVVAR